MNIAEFTTICIDQDGEEKSYLIKKQYSEMTGQPFQICDLIGRQANVSMLPSEDIYRITEEARRRFNLI